MRRATLVLALTMIAATASAFTAGRARIETRRAGSFATRPPSATLRAPGPAPSNRVTRPAPPLVRSFRAFGPPDREPRFRHHHHHHHDRPIIVFQSPGFYSNRSCFYPYSPYSPCSAYGYDSFYSFGWPYRGIYPFTGYAESPPVASAPGAIDAPYYCWVDGLGFTDEAAFADHLHDAHGVPRVGALAHAESVGGRLVYFGR